MQEFRASFASPRKYKLDIEGENFMFSVAYFGLMFERMLHTSFSNGANSCYDEVGEQIFGWGETRDEVAENVRICTSMVRSSAV